MKSTKTNLDPNKKKKNAGKKNSSANKPSKSKIAFDNTGKPIEKKVMSKPLKVKKEPVKKMEHIREKCVGLTEDAKGMVMYNGKELLVPYLLEGEKALIEVRNSGKFSSRKVVSLMTKSDGRVEPDCPYFYDCGGCQIQHMDYKTQLSFKENLVSKLLKKYGKVDKIISMENPYEYRNKSHATYASHDKNNVISGIYKEYTHDVVSIDKCIIQSPIADSIFNTIKDLAKTFKLRIYNEDTENGFLRHTLIRTAKSTGQVMVVFVVTEKTFPSKAKFMNELLEKHPEITTIVLNVNDKKTTMILGDKEIVVHGNGYIEDILCGLRFRISPKSFYQINHEQTEKLYNKAIELANISKAETVFDAYSGIGTIGLIASQFAKEVVGVELNEEAVKNAVSNASINNIENARFYKGDAGHFMNEIAKENVKFDTVFMDPPRSGSDEKFLSSIVRLSPKKVIYISCNPVTQEKDLKYLVERGYRVEKIVPVDMFPQTYHVECIVKLTKK